MLPAECNPDHRDGVEDDYDEFGDTTWKEDEQRVGICDMKPQDTGINIQAMEG